MRLERTPTASILLLVAATLLAAWVSSLGTADAEPRFWNGPDGWAYRKQLNVTIGNPNVSVTDHQVAFVFPTSTLVSAGKLQADCTDLRFATDDGAILSHWIEAACNSASTRVWVKVPSASGAAPRKLYAYYGNPGAPQVSSPNGTFISNSIRYEVSDCVESPSANTCAINGHANADTARDRAADLCSGATSRVEWGYICTGAGPGTHTTNGFSVEYRFLFVPDVSGLWGFGVRADNWSELASSATDEVLTVSHIPIAEGAYADNPGETYENVTLTAGAGRWYSFVAAEGSGTELQRLRLARPGGAYETLNTTSFPGMIFRRSYSVVEPDVEVSGVEEALPGAVQSLAVVPGPGAWQVNATWSAPSSNGGAPVTGYRVWSASSPVGPWSQAGNVSGTSALVTTPPGETRYVRVQAQTVRGMGVNASSSGTAWDHPSAPQDVVATPQNHSILLTWTAPASDGGEPIDGFRILMPTDSVVWIPIASTTNGANTSFVMNGLTNGSSYTFRVAAYNLVGQGDMSGSVSAVPGARPDPPKSLAAARGNGTISLSWTPGHNGSYPLTGYHVWLGTSPGAQSIVATTANGANTSFTLSGLTNGVTYYANVTALNALGQSASSNVVSAKPATVPLPPTITGVTEGNGTLTLTWALLGPSPANGGEPVSGFTLYEGTSPASLAANGTFGGASTGATLARPNGQERHFRLVATNAVGSSAQGNLSNGTPGTVPYPPTAALATAGNATVSVTWGPPVSDGGRAISYYRLALFPNAPEASQEALVTGMSHTFVGLTNTTSYTVFVWASNSLGESTFANASTVTPMPLRPDPPAQLVATRGNGSVALSWTPGYHATPLTGYTIWRATTSGNEIAIANTTNGANTSFTVNGLANGLTYFFNVTARSAEGMSLSSNEASAKPATIPNPPGSVAVSRGNHSATLTWATPASGGEPILGYDIHRIDGSPVLVAQTTNGANVSFTVNGLANGVPATFQVRARNVVGTSAPSIAVSATPAGVPFPPTLLSASRGNANVTLSWTNGASDGVPITGTRLLQGTSPGSLSFVANLSPGATSHVRAGLTNGVTYYFALQHNSSVGLGNLSAEHSAKPAREPDAPGAFLATFGDTNVTLTWATPANGGEPLTNLTIERGLTPGSLQAIAVLDPTNTSFVSAGLTNGVTYHFRVKASNVVGANASIVRSAMPGRVPDAPTALTAEAEEGAVSLAWTATADDGGRPLLGYTVYRAAGEGALAFLDDIGTNTSYTAEGLENGVTYRFAVRARNALGLSAPSDTVAATPLTTPDAPQGVAATLFAPEVTITWLPPANSGGAPVSQYRVYASDLPGGARWLVGTVDGDTLQLVDDAPPATLRHYVVRALNVAGEGAASAEAAGATPADPLAPTLPETYRSCVREATTQTASCTPGASESVVGAAAGARHTCALLASGRVDCYGDDGAGQSGDHLAGQPAVSVSAGGLHTCALLDDGNVDCWGNNGFGRAASYLGGDAVAVTAGGGHTCFVTLAGAATCQGLDGYGQAASRNSDVEAAAAGGYHTCFLLTSGVVECQGLNDRGQSNGDATGDVVQVTAGGFHACALTFGQTVRCWGAIAAVPPAVQGNALEIASGADHACALLQDGNVRCWGATRDGQSVGYQGGDATRVYAGGSHACVLTTAGALSCWGAEGASNHGQATAYPGTTGVPTPNDPLPTTATVALPARREEA